MGGMDPAPASGSTVAPAAIDALLAVLRPLARLAIDHGVQFGQLEELLKHALFDAALAVTRAESPQAVPPVSRLSVMTGIHRKEVKRLSESPTLGTLSVETTPTAEVFARWTADPPGLAADGRPRDLPRRIGADRRPGFEQLARSVTTDVHPRTLLDEMARLELAVIDPVNDTVRLAGDTNIPTGGQDAMLAFLGANVGDHLAAARANVAVSTRGGTPPAKPPFVEQAVFADELSPESVEIASERARSAWQQLAASLVPELMRLEAADRAAGRPADRRIRIGLYSFSEPMPPPAAGESSSR